MDSEIPDPYKTLGVPKDAEISAIKSAYRKLALKCHPDKVSDPDQKAVKQKEFYAVQQAYEILGDEFKKREYDAQARLHKMRDEVFSSGSPHPKSSPRSSSKAFYEPSYQNVNIRTAEPPKSFKASPSSGPYSNPFPQYAGSFEREMPVRSKSMFDEDRKARRAQSYEKPSRRDEEARDREAREIREAKEERRRRREEEDRMREERERRERREAKKLKEAEREREIERQERKARERREKQELREAEEREYQRQKKKRDQAAKERDIDRARRAAQEEKTRAKKEPYIETESEEDPRLSKKKSSSSAKKNVSPSRREKSSRSQRAEAEIIVKMDNKLMAASEHMLRTRRRGSKTEHAGYSPEATFTDQFPNPSHWQPKPDKFATVETEEPEIIEASTRGPPRLMKSYTMPAGHMHMASSSPNSSSQRVPSLNRAATGLDGYQSSSARAPAVPQAPERHHPHRSERRRKSVAEDDHHRGSHTYRSYPVHHEESIPRVGAGRYMDPEEIYGSIGGRSQFGRVKVAERLSPEEVYAQRSAFDADQIQYSHVPHDIYHARTTGIYG